MARTPDLRHLQRLWATARELNRHPGMGLEELRTRLQSRREFLATATKWSLAAVPAAHLLSACSHRPSYRILASDVIAPEDTFRKNSDEPVAIIGAGIAGLTAAFHLTNARIACRVFEATQRVGGRMFTKLDFNPEGMVCELGGEFVDSDHLALMSLCEFFKIPLDEVAAADAGLVPNLYYFADASGAMRFYRDEDALRALQTFDQRFIQDQKSLGDPNALKKFDQLSLQQYLDGYRGEVDAWFLELLRVAYVGESGLEADEQPALNLLYMLSPGTETFRIFGDSDQSKRIRGGNQALIGALEGWLKSRGVTFEKGSPLVAIQNKGTKLALTFGHGKTKTRDFSRVICAIPFSVLRQVDGIFSLEMNSLKKRAIREIAYATNGKYMFGYGERSWRKEMPRAGRLAVPASNGMVYTNRFVQNVWETSGGQRGTSGILTVYLGGKSGAALGFENRSACHAALREIFPGSEKHLGPKEALFNWTRHPYSRGSYVCGRPGQNELFGEQMGTPELGGRLFFAGEHVASKFKGFMNGGCLSGQEAAEALIAKLP